MLPAAPSAAAPLGRSHALPHLNKTTRIKMKRLHIVLAVLALAALALVGHSVARAASLQAKGCCPGGSCCDGGACCR